VTTYCAAVFAGAADPDAARALVEFIGTDEGRGLCVASGLEF
jgi:ABC-type Fe3+ transport system substrate-binding protein